MTDLDWITESVSIGGIVYEQEDASEWISEVYEAFNGGNKAQSLPDCYLEAQALEEASYPRSIDKGCFFPILPGFSGQFFFLFGKVRSLQKNQ